MHAGQLGRHRRSGGRRQPPAFVRRPLPLSAAAAAVGAGRSPANRHRVHHLVGRQQEHSTILQHAVKLSGACWCKDNLLAASTRLGCTPRNSCGMAAARLKTCTIDRQRMKSQHGTRQGRTAYLATRTGVEGESLHHNGNADGGCTRWLPQILQAPASIKTASTQKSRSKQPAGHSPWRTYTLSRVTRRKSSSAGAKPPLCIHTRCFTHAKLPATTAASTRLHHRKARDHLLLLRSLKELPYSSAAAPWALPPLLPLLRPPL